MVSARAASQIVMLSYMLIGLKSTCIEAVLLATLAYTSGQVSSHVVQSVIGSTQPLCW